MFLFLGRDKLKSKLEIFLTNMVEIESNLQEKLDESNIKPGDDVVVMVTVTAPFITSNGFIIWFLCE